MHINFRHAHDEYSQTEIVHLQQCHQCQEDVKSIEQLTSAGQVMPTLIPDELNWQVIQQRTLKREQKPVTPATKKNRLFIYTKLMAIAASTFFIAVGWLVWSNYQLQSQLEQVLLVNQSLELQLFENSAPSFHQANVLNEVRNIELQLINEKSNKRKLALLTARKQLIQEIVNIQNGNENAIYL